MTTLLAFLHFLIILLTVAFFTLLERKLMGRFHLRMGPNKTGALGLLQPLLDALKLFLKARISPSLSRHFFYIYAPLGRLFCSILVFVVIPNAGIQLNDSFSMLFFLVLRTLIIFFLLIRSWASNSKYALLGGLRRVRQAISYEAVFRTLIMLIIITFVRISILNLTIHSRFLILSIFLFWLISTLGETHRAPFDFREAESELVSGFNTEYSGKIFAFLFLGEYIILLFRRLLMGIFFMLGPLHLSVIHGLQICSLLCCFLIIWIRITFCRFRYDLLMRLAWKTLLPELLAIFILGGFILV